MRCYLVLCPHAFLPRGAPQATIKFMGPQASSSSSGPSSKATEPSASGVLRGLLRVSKGTFLSRILGLVRDMVLTHFLSKESLDSFLVAFRIPSALRAILGESPLSASFLPFYVDALGKQGQPTQASRDLSKALGLWLLGVLALLMGLGVLQAELLLSWLVSQSFEAQTERFQQVVLLSQILFGFLFFAVISAYFMSLLQAHGRFFQSGASSCYLQSLFHPFHRHFLLVGGLLGDAECGGGAFGAVSGGLSRGSLKESWAGAAGFRLGLRLRALFSVLSLSFFLFKSQFLSIWYQEFWLWLRLNL